MAGEHESYYTFHRETVQAEFTPRHSIAFPWAHTQAVAVKELAAAVIFFF